MSGPTCMALDGVPAEEYHSDAISVDDRPSLSASIAKILVAESPAHAYAAHPKLNPAWAPADEQKFDLGTVVHQLLLDEHARVEVIHFDSWRTAEAKQCRDVARAAGKTPLLAADWARATEIADAIRGQVAGLDVQPPLLTDGKPEQTLVWEENGVACKARLDWLRDDRAAIDDIKTTSRSANPDTWSRTVFSMGYDIQAAFYLRGVKAVTGSEPDFRLVVCETDPPYALSVIGMTPGALELANAKVDWALATWKRCLADDVWPGYAKQVAYAVMPSYEESRWLEKEAREVAA